jgi:hypothetical protein
MFSIWNKNSGLVKHKHHIPSQNSYHTPPWNIESSKPTRCMFPFFFTFLKNFTTRMWIYDPCVDVFRGACSAVPREERGRHAYRIGTSKFPPFLLGLYLYHFAFTTCQRIYNYERLAIVPGVQSSRSLGNTSAERWLIVGVTPFCLSDTQWLIERHVYRLIHSRYMYALRMTSGPHCWLYA